MGFGCNGMRWGSWGGHGLVGPILGFVVWAVVLVALVVGIVWLVRRLGTRPKETQKQETPLNAARRRLASGEITVGEFDEIARRLQRESEPSGK